jgi:hypothetical protein
MFACFFKSLKGPERKALISSVIHTVPVVISCRLVYDSKFNKITHDILFADDILFLLSMVLSRTTIHIKLYCIASQDIRE